MLCDAVSEEQRKCRGEVVSALHKVYLTAFCRETQKLEDNLDRDERERIIEQTMTAYNGLLRALGAEPISRSFLKSSISVVPATAASEPDSEDLGPVVSPGPVP